MLREQLAEHVGHPCTAVQIRAWELNQDTPNRPFMQRLLAIFPQLRGQRPRVVRAHHVADIIPAEVTYDQDRLRSFYTAFSNVSHGMAWRRKHYELCLAVLNGDVTEDDLRRIFGIA